MLLFRYDYHTNTVYQVTLPEVTGPAFFMPIACTIDRYLVGNATGAVEIIWDGTSSTATFSRSVFTVPAGELLNSAYVMPNGDLIVGTFGIALCTSPAANSLYKYTVSTGLVKLFGSLVSTEGSVLVGNTLYHLDGCTKNLYATDVDQCTGNLCKGNFNSFHV